MNQVIVVAKTEASRSNVISRAFRPQIVRRPEKITSCDAINGEKTLLAWTYNFVSVPKPFSGSCGTHRRFIVRPPFSGPEESNKKAITIKGEKRDKSDKRRKIIISTNKARAIIPP